MHSGILVVLSRWVASDFSFLNRLQRLWDRLTYVLHTHAYLIQRLCIPRIHIICTHIYAYSGTALCTWTVSHLRPLLFRVLAYGRTYVRILPYTRRLAIIEFFLIAALSMIWTLYYGCECNTRPVWGIWTRVRYEKREIGAHRREIAIKTSAELIKWKKEQYLWEKRSRCRHRHRRRDELILFRFFRFHFTLWNLGIESSRRCKSNSFGI